MAKIERIACECLELAHASGVHLASAESLTGGQVAAAITAISGASDVFLGGVVSYSEEVKMLVLSVSPETLAKHTVYSHECAQEMAEGVLKLMEADFSVATTGVAGPNGGSDHAPVGTVYIACASPNKTFSQEFHFSGSRETIQKESVAAALSMLSNVLREKCSKL